MKKIKILAILMIIVSIFAFNNSYAALKSDASAKEIKEYVNNKKNDISNESISDLLLWYNKVASDRW